MKERARTYGLSLAAVPFCAIATASALAGCSSGSTSAAPAPVALLTFAPTPSPAPRAPAMPAATAMPTPTTAPAQTYSTRTQDAGWPTFAHDIARTSTLTQPTALSRSSVGTLQLLWTYVAPAMYDLASPIAENGIVYAADIAGNVTAFDEATGTIVWTRAFGVEMKMTPELYDGHLFVATFINQPNTPSTLYALDPASGSTQWSTSVPGGVHGSPVVAGGEIYVPLSLGDPGYCDADGVYAFTESTGQPVENWLTGGQVVADGGAVWSPLTFDGTRILFGTGNTCIDQPRTGNAIAAVSLADQLLWADPTADAFTDDDVAGGVIESGNTAYITAKNGNLYAFDPASGAIDWQVNLGAPDLYGSYSTPTFAAGTLMSSIGYNKNPFIAAPEGTTYGTLDGLDPSSGAVRWQRTALSPFYEPVAMAGGVGFLTIDSAVAAIDPATGATLWSQPIEGSSRSAVIAVDDEVIAADSTGRLYAYGLPTAANAALRRRTASEFVVRPSVPRFVNHVPVFCKI